MVLFRTSGDGRRANDPVLSHFETRAQKLVFFGFALLLVALLRVTVRSVANPVRRPWPGLAVWRNLVAPAIGTSDWPGAGAGVPQREVVVSANGAPVADAAGLRAVVGEAAPGEVVRYSFRRGARSSAVEVPTAVLR